MLKTKLGRGIVAGAALLGAFGLFPQAASAQNDACATTALSMSPGDTITVDTTGLGTAGPPSCATNPGSVVWVTLSGLTPGNSYTMTTLDNGDVDDTALQVLDACGGTSLGCNSDIGGGNWFSTVTFTAGGTTAVAVMSSEFLNFGTPAEGSWDVELVDNGSAIDPVAECNAALLSLAPGNTISADTTGANNSVNPGCGSGNSGGDVWIELTGLTPGFVYEVETLATGTAEDTSIELYESCGGAIVGCNDDGGDGFMSLLSFTATASTHYLVASSDWGDPEGTFDVSLSAGVAPPAGNDCSLAIPVTGGDLPFSESYLVAGYTDSGDWRGSDITGGTGLGIDVWWAFTPDTTGAYAIDLSYDDLSAALTVWTASDPSSPCETLVYTGDFGFSNPPDDVSIAPTLTAGQTYYIVYEDAFPGGAGDFGLSIDGPLPAVANDFCADAELLDLSTLPVSVTGTTTGAAAEFTVNFGTFSATGPDVYYTFTAPTSEDYRFQLANDPGNPTADADIYLTTATLCGALPGTFALQGPEIVDFSAFIGDEDGIFSLEAGETYFLVVKAFSGGETGDFTLTVLERGTQPANDDCEGAELLADGVTVSASTSVLTLQFFGSAPLNGPDLFYTYIASDDGDLVITVDPTTSGFDVSLAALAPDNCESFPLFAAGTIVDDAGPQARGVETLTFPVESGDEVLIVVASPDGSSGDFDITATLTNVASVEDWHIMN